MGKVAKKKNAEAAPVVLDATGAAAGRLAAFCAKAALSCAKVDVVNAEKAEISGDPVKVAQKYANRRHMTQKSNPENAAKWPRRPDYLFKTIVKGMLPKKKPGGKAALSRVTAHIGVPAQFEGKARKFATKEQPKGISLDKLCRQLGWM